MDNGISAKAPPSTQLLQVGGGVGEGSRQWFQEVTEKDRRHEFNREDCWSVAPSLHLRTAHTRGRVGLQLSWSSAWSVCRDAKSRPHPLFIEHLLSSRQALKLNILTVIYPLHLAAVEDKSQLSGTPLKTSKSYDVYQTKYDPPVSMASNNGACVTVATCPWRVAAALLRVPFTLGPRLTQEPPSGMMSSWGRNRHTWEPARWL